MIEIILLVLSVLIFISIIAGRIGTRLGVPTLVLFLAVGMIAGGDGVGIQFNDYRTAETIGTVSLCIILFSGGLATSMNEIKPVIAQSIVLSTLGVLITASLTGFFAWWIIGELLPAFGLSLLTALLLASVMSSTDSAAVFSILGSSDTQLKNNLRGTLECESGSNDPMAYMLTITIIGLINAGGEPNIGGIIINIIQQIVIGAVGGYLLGRLAIWLINRMKVDNEAYYPIIILTFCIFIFSFTHVIGGNGYLAVYLGGLIIGNSDFVDRRITLKFFDAISWFCQIVMFITLGLLVNPHDLPSIAIPALLIGLFVIFLARPIAVFICFLPFRRVGLKDKIFISWVGLRGAVPIIFAIYPLTAGVPYAQFIFNVVFFITVLSVLLQGTFLTTVAKKLDLIAPSRPRPKKMKDFDRDTYGPVSLQAEIEVNANTLRNGSRLMDLNLPDNVLIAMIKRNEEFFVPKGKTELEIGDKLLVMTNKENTLDKAFEILGVKSH